MFIVDRCVEGRSSVGAERAGILEGESTESAEDFAPTELASAPPGFYKHFTPTEFRNRAPLNTSVRSSAQERAQLCSSSFGKGLTAAILAAALILTSGTSLAQSKKKKTPNQSQPTISDKMKKAKEDVIAAAKDYKASLEKVLKFQEDDVKAAAGTLEKRKVLLAENIISKKELEESERALSAAEAKLADTKRQMGEADNLIAEASAEKQLIRLGPSPLGAYQATAALIRYNGPTHWALSDASKVEGFFEKSFHHALPISAFGQTAVHDQLGFDHHNAMDVAVSPDSAEGQSLMTYLRDAGIPFIAFRHAVKGSATGAHIHIGLPSRRVSK
jgi:hypothetical protein